MSGKRKPLTQLSLEQVIREKRRKSTSDEPSSSVELESNVRAGGVLRMVLKNFMCHEHLEVKFTRNINYVIGQNGSGKSALLTALIVGLGGKASLTNRGNSIKAFIKNGQTSACVEITLSNSGPLSYRHNIYGDKIIVIRTFSAKGSSSYKLKSVFGDVISTSPKEITKMCMSLSIEVDNPICLLNQDTARNFLSTKDPLKKFLLFMRATRLEEICEKYRTLKDKQKSASRVLKEKEVALDELGTKLKKLKVKLDNQKEIGKLNARVIEMQLESLWSGVKNQEGEFNKQQEQVDVLQVELSEIQSQIGNNNQLQESANQVIQGLEVQIRELHASIEDQNIPQNILVRSLGELKESIVNKNREKRVLQKDIALKTGNCGILEREIQNITENFSKLEAEKIKRIQEIADTEEKIQNIESLLATSKNDQFQMLNSANRIREQENSLVTELQQINCKIEKINLRVASLKGQSSNNLSIYGRDMVKVVEAIEAKRNQFKQMPRGPLGSYIKLKDKKWAVAVEGLIGGALLRAFVVDNGSDNQVLMKILDTYWSGPNKPSVITTKFIHKMHDVRENLVQPIDGCTSVYSVLEISDPVVSNCLIDQSSVESVMLIPNNDTAINLMSDERCVPKNCRQGITIKGDRYYPDPNYKCYASRYHNAQFLQVSVQEVIGQLKEEMAELHDNKKTVNNQYQSVKKESQEQAQNVKQLEVKVSKLNSALSRLKILYDNLKNVAEPDVASVHAMENELTELKQLIEQRKTVSQTIIEDIAEIQRQIDRKDEKLNAIKVVVRGYEERTEALNKQLDEQVAKQNSCEVNKRFDNNRLGEAKKRVNNAQTKLAEKRELLKRCTDKALKVGPRPELIRAVKVIENDLNECKRSITVIETDKDTAEEIIEKYQTTSELHTNSTKMIRCMHENLSFVQEAVEKRRRYCEHIADYFVQFVRHSFKGILEFRQFEGNIDINLKEKKLDLIVIPQQGTQGFTTSTNLSGGERSFATVAFLYALWNCMEFPFYFLDEFDVFMDKLNRAKVMEILLHHAKSRSHLQFVFLTPQDVSFVKDKSVAIHRLDDPERE